jgi:hypothetical protein
VLKKSDVKYLKTDGLVCSSKSMMVVDFVLPVVCLRQGVVNDVDYVFARL